MHYPAEFQHQVLSERAIFQVGLVITDLYIDAMYRLSVPFTPPCLLRTWF